MFRFLDSSGKEEDSKHLPPEEALPSLHSLNDEDLFPEGTTIRVRLYCSPSWAMCCVSLSWCVLCLLGNACTWLTWGLHSPSYLNSSRLQHLPSPVSLWLTSFQCSLQCQQPTFCKEAAGRQWTHLWSGIYMAFFYSPLCSTPHFVLLPLSFKTGILNFRYVWEPPGVGTLKKKKT